MCSYTMVAASGFEVLSFSQVKFHSLSHEDQSTITVSLPPNKHFNLTITAYNAYGNTSSTVVMSKSVLEKTLLYIWSCAHILSW